MLFHIMTYQRYTVL